MSEENKNEEQDSLSKDEGHELEIPKKPEETEISEGKKESEAPEEQKESEPAKEPEASEEPEASGALQEEAPIENSGTSEENFESQIEDSMARIIWQSEDEEGVQGGEAVIPDVQVIPQSKVLRPQTPTKQPVAAQAKPAPRRAVQVEEHYENRHTGMKVFCTILAAIILAGAGAYFGMSYYYSDKFFKGTMINSFDCSEMTVAECEALIRKKVENYSLTVAARNQEPQEITAQSIDYKYASDGAVEKALEAQNPMEWIKGYFMTQEYTAAENISYDKEKVKEQLEALACMQQENQVQPVDARIEFQDQLFVIIPGEEGSAIDENLALEALYKAIDQTETAVNLEEAGAYLQPNVRAEDPGLIERLKIVNAYAKASITLTFGDRSEVLDSTTFKDWYSTDANGDLYLDGEVLKSKLTEYVAGLASKYNTLGATRTFTATSGRTVQVSGGNYGYQLAQYDEVEEMYEEILNGEEVVREPIYSSTGNSWSNGSDLGDTYIEVDIEEQHMYFYKNGKNIFESDFVSGNMEYSDRATPAGVCHLTYKTKDFTLRGEKKEDGTYEYEEPVSYWMPFNGGVGFHDAPWRSEFGGDTYLTSGSHGCVNMPKDKAKELYDLIDESIPIVVFY